MTTRIPRLSSWLRLNAKHAGANNDNKNSENKESPLNSSPTSVVPSALADENFEQSTSGDAAISQTIVASSTSVGHGPDNGTIAPVCTVENCTKNIASPTTTLLNPNTRRRGKSRLTRTRSVSDLWREQAAAMKGTTERSHRSFFRRIPTRRNNPTIDLHEDVTNSTVAIDNSYHDQSVDANTPTFSNSSSNSRGHQLQQQQSTLEPETAKVQNRINNIAQETSSTSPACDCTQNNNYVTANEPTDDSLHAATGFIRADEQIYLNSEQYWNEPVFMKEMITKELHNQNQQLQPSGPGLEFTEVSQSQSESPLQSILPLTNSALHEAHGRKTEQTHIISTAPQLQSNAECQHPLFSDAVPQNYSWQRQNQQTQQALQSLHIAPFVVTKATHSGRYNNFINICNDNNKSQISSNSGSFIQVLPHPFFATSQRKECSNCAALDAELLAALDDIEYLKTLLNEREKERFKHTQSPEHKRGTSLFVETSKQTTEARKQQERQTDVVIKENTCYKHEALSRSNMYDSVYNSLQEENQTNTRKIASLQKELGELKNERYMLTLENLILRAKAAQHERDKEELEAVKAELQQVQLQGLKHAKHAIKEREEIIVQLSSRLEHAMEQLQLE